MTQWYYLFALVLSISCLLLIDRRLKLAFWHDARRSITVIGFAIAFFIIWDLLGISFGIFFDGMSAYMLPVRLLPHFPIEELFFLFLLNYVVLLLYTGGQKRWPRI